MFSFIVSIIRNDASIKKKICWFKKKYITLQSERIYNKNTNI